MFEVRCYSKYFLYYILVYLASLISVSNVTRQESRILVLAGRKKGFLIIAKSRNTGAHPVSCLTDSSLYVQQAQTPPPSVSKCSKLYPTRSTQFRGVVFRKRNNVILYHYRYDLYVGIRK
jgi:hypothetical protein